MINQIEIKKSKTKIKNQTEIRKPKIMNQIETKKNKLKNQSHHLEKFTDLSMFEML